MKINDKKELHTKSASELKKMLGDGNELLLSLKLDREQNKLKNTRGIFNTRKNIAIIKSILKGKEEQGASEQEAPAAEEVTPVAAKTKKETPSAKE